MRTQQFIQCHEGLNTARVTITTEDLGSVVLVGVVGISNAQVLVGCYWPKLLLTMIYRPP